MIVSAGGAAVGAEPGTGSEPRREPGGTRGRTRRETGRGLLAAAAALALTPLVAASRPQRSAEGSGDRFDETYRGRHIQGAMIPTAGRAIGDGEWQVTVDGHPLHLMRRADGTWLTMLDHYSSYRTPLEATRAAVDELGPGERLRDDLAPGPAGPEHLHTGGGHGVRA